MTFSVSLFTKLTNTINVMCGSFVQNFRETREKIWKEQVGIYLIPKGKYGFHFAGIHKVRTHSINFVDISFTEYYPRGGKSYGK